MLPATRPSFRLMLVAVLLHVALAPTARAQRADASAASLPPSLETAVRRAAEIPRLYSLLVSRHSKVLTERYFNGATASQPANIKSASKSVISALVGIAIEQGHLSGVDQTIGEFFPAELEREDVRKADITIGDLLTMRSGLETTSNRNYGAWVLSSNWVEFALHQPFEHVPGRVMEYSTGNTHLLSAILTDVTGLSTLEFARGALAEPLGFRLSEWPRDPQGIYFGGNDMVLTPRQMLAFGQLYLDDGRANGRQIIPQAWVRASLRPRTESRREHGRYYGYGWWIRRIAGLQAPYAWGYGGQFIVLVPDLDLVVVTTSDSTPGDGRRAQRRAVLSLIERFIVAPLARSGVARAASGDAG